MIDDLRRECRLQGVYILVQKRVGGRPAVYLIARYNEQYLGTFDTPQQAVKAYDRYAGTHSETGAPMRSRRTIEEFASRFTQIQSEIEACKQRRKAARCAR
jgi:hypothetical protein